MLKMHPQLASLGQKPPTGAGGPGEDGPLLIIPAAGKKVQPGTPEIMESGGGSRQQAAEKCQQLRLQTANSHLISNPGV